MRAKLFTLILGVPPVALGVRWTVENHVSVWPFVAAIGLFLGGQYIVRFEDYPGGREFVSRFTVREK